MNARLSHPTIPAASEGQESAPAPFVACEKFGDSQCCEWACCKRPVTHRAPKEPSRVAVLDIEAMANLSAPLGSPEFFEQWHDASARKEADYLAGDRTSHRKAWEV
jgi:hypothetical protein